MEFSIFHSAHYDSNYHHVIQQMHTIHHHHNNVILCQLSHVSVFNGPSSVRAEFGGGEREREKLTDCCVHLWLMWLTCKGNSDYRWFCVYMLSLKHNPCVKCDATVYVMFVTICETNATFLNLTWKGSYSFLISSKNDRKFSQGRQKNKVWRGPLHPHRLVCLLINSV